MMFSPFSNAADANKPRLMKRSHRAKQQQQQQQQRTATTTTTTTETTNAKKQSYPSAQALDNHSVTNSNWNK